MVRRRRLLDRGGMPAELQESVPGHWSGGSEYQQWMVWNATALEWAAKNLPDGVEGLPDRLTRAASTPDQPWREVVF